MSEQSRESLEAVLLRKAATDDTFRRALVSTPREAVEQFGVRVPPGIEIQVVEETPSKVCIVLPMRATAAEGGELSEQDLDRVVGGAEVAPLPSGILRLRNFSFGRGDSPSVTPINLPEIV